MVCLVAASSLGLSNISSRGFLALSPPVAHSPRAAGPDEQPGLGGGELIADVFKSCRPDAILSCFRLGSLMV